MDFYEQTDAFTFEVDSLVDRYMRDFDINIYTIVGVLEAKQKELLEMGQGFEFRAEDGILPDDDDPIDFPPDFSWHLLCNMLEYYFNME